jgi:hypothetical protein
VDNHQVVQVVVAVVQMAAPIPLLLEQRTPAVAVVVVVSIKMEAVVLEVQE